jgi:hypothetical protein
MERANQLASFAVTSTVLFTKPVRPSSVENWGGKSFPVIAVRIVGNRVER